MDIVVKALEEEVNHANLVRRNALLPLIFSLVKRSTNPR